MRLWRISSFGVVRGSPNFVTGYVFFTHSFRYSLRLIHTLSMHTYVTLEPQAFNLKRGRECQRVSDLIPDQVQVLLTHGPPLGHGDVTSSGLRVGCEDLMYTTKSRLSNLRVHLFGHIHEGYGVTRDFNGVVYANASTCNHRYIPKHPAIVIDIPRPSDEEAKRNLGILHSVRKKRADDAASGLVF